MVVQDDLLKVTIWVNDFLVPRSIQAVVNETIILVNLIRIIGR